MPVLAFFLVAKTLVKLFFEEDLTLLCSTNSLRKSTLLGQISAISLKLCKRYKRLSGGQNHLFCVLELFFSHGSARDEIGDLVDLLF